MKTKWYNRNKYDIFKLPANLFLMNYEYDFILKYNGEEIGSSLTLLDCEWNRFMKPINLICREEGLDILPIYHIMIKGDILSIYKNKTIKYKITCNDKRIDEKMGEAKIIEILNGSITIETIEPMYVSENNSQSFSKD